ncbi:hypothetical protein N0V83_004754 [Neocucurbitaria cava]|uniref:Uncharacterized protein n=1 Tax=Neocucurbitaria cava TaxID=798079 RepID=A0A9W9CN84_9PLEO|nr:hypothetical protein N0V83_004754 [Neocucurbitaria cava]
MNGFDDTDLSDMTQGSPKKTPLPVRPELSRPNGRNDMTDRNDGIAAQANNAQQSDNSISDENEARRKCYEDLEAKLHWVMSLFSEKDECAKVNYKKLAISWESRLWELTQKGNKDIPKYIHFMMEDLRRLDRWGANWKTGKGHLTSRILNKLKVLPDDQQSTAKIANPFVPKAPRTRKRTAQIDTSEFMPKVYTPVDEDQANREARAAAAKIKEDILNDESFPTGQLSSEDEKRRQSRRELRNAVNELIKLLPKTDELSKIDVTELAALKETAIYGKTCSHNLDNAKYDAEVLEEQTDLENWVLYWDSDEADPEGGNMGINLFRQYVPEELAQKSRAFVHEASLHLIVPADRQTGPIDEVHVRQQGVEDLEKAVGALIMHYDDIDEMSQVNVPKVAETWEHRVWQDTYAKTHINNGLYEGQILEDCIELETIFPLNWEYVVHQPRIGQEATGSDAFRIYFKTHFGEEYLYSYRSPKIDSDEEISDLDESELNEELYVLAGGNQDDEQDGSCDYYGQEEKDMASVYSDHDSDDEFRNGLFTGGDAVIESPASPSPSQQGPSGGSGLEGIEGEIVTDNTSQTSALGGETLLSHHASLITVAGNVGSKLDSIDSAAPASNSPNLHNESPCDDYDMNVQEQEQAWVVQSPPRVPPEAEEGDKMDLECLIESGMCADKEGELKGDLQGSEPGTMPNATGTYHGDGKVGDLEMSEEMADPPPDTTTESMALGDPISHDELYQMFMDFDQDEIDEAKTKDANIEEPKTEEVNPPIFTTTGTIFGSASMANPSPVKKSATVIDFGVNTANLAPLKGRTDAPQAISQQPGVFARPFGASLAKPRVPHSEPIEVDMITPSPATPKPAAPKPTAPKPRTSSGLNFFSNLLKEASSGPKLSPWTPKVTPAKNSEVKSSSTPSFSKQNKGPSTSISSDSSKGKYEDHEMYDAHQTLSHQPMAVSEPMDISLVEPGPKETANPKTLLVDSKPTVIGVAPVPLFSPQTLNTMDKVDKFATTIFSASPKFGGPVLSGAMTQNFGQTVLPKTAAPNNGGGLPGLLYHTPIAPNTGLSVPQVSTPPVLATGSSKVWEDAAMTDVDTFTPKKSQDAVMTEETALAKTSTLDTVMTEETTLAKIETPEQVSLAIEQPIAQSPSKLISTNNELQSLANQESKETAQQPLAITQDSVTLGQQSTRKIEMAAPHGAEDSVMTISPELAAIINGFSNPAKIEKLATADSVTETEKYSLVNQKLELGTRQPVDTAQDTITPEERATQKESLVVQKPEQSMQQSVGTAQDTVTPEEWSTRESLVVQEPEQSIQEPAGTAQDTVTLEEQSAQTKEVAALNGAENSVSTICPGLVAPTNGPRPPLAKFVESTTASIGQFEQILLFLKAESDARKSAESKQQQANDDILRRLDRIESERHDTEELLGRLSRVEAALVEQKQSPGSSEKPLAEREIAILTRQDAATAHEKEQLEILQKKTSDIAAREKLLVDRETAMVAREEAAKTYEQQQLKLMQQREADITAREDAVEAKYKQLQLKVEELEQKSQQLEIKERELQKKLKIEQSTTSEELSIPEVEPPSNATPLVKAEVPETPNNSKPAPAKQTAELIPQQELHANENTLRGFFKAKTQPKPPKAILDPATSRFDLSCLTQGQLVLYLPPNTHLSEEGPVQHARQLQELLFFKANFEDDSAMAYKKLPQAMYNVLEAWKNGDLASLFSIATGWSNPGAVSEQHGFMAKLENVKTAFDALTEAYGMLETLATQYSSRKYNGTRHEIKALLRSSKRIFNAYVKTLIWVNSNLSKGTEMRRGVTGVLEAEHARLEALLKEGGKKFNTRMGLAPLKRHGKKNE